MKKHRWICVLVLLFACGIADAKERSVGKAAPNPFSPPLSSSEASKPSTPLLDLPSAKMEVSWSDIKVLLERTLEEPEKEEEEPAPPVPWTLARADYDAIAESNRSVRITGRLRFMAWEEKAWLEIPLLGNTIAPESVELDGEETFLNRNRDGAFSILLKEPGVHELVVVFHVACENRDGVVSFSFPCAATAVTRMDLEIPVGNAGVKAPKAASLKLWRQQDATNASLVFLPTDTIDVSWTLPAVIQAQKAKAAKLKPKPEAPRVTLHSLTLASVSEHHVACESRLNFDVLRGGKKSFRLRVPKDVKVLTVEGQGATWSSESDDEGTVTDVRLNHEVKDNYQLLVRYEVPIPEQAATVAVPRIEAEDMARQTGQIGVSVRGTLRVEASPETTLPRIDTSELAAALRALSPSPIQLAYRSAEAGDLLAVDLHRLEHVPVRVASIDLAELNTMVTEDGARVTRATYHVRNNVKQFLRVSLPANAEVWGAEVDGMPVKPAKETDSKGLLLPLVKSVRNSRDSNAFPVSVVYVQRDAPGRGLRSALALASPATDVLADEVRWHVYLPDGRRYAGAEGDLKPMGQPRAGLRKKLGRGERNTRSETVYALREGIERFYITDINNPAASVGGPRKHGKPLDAAPATRSDFAIAGVLPIRINMPTEGTRHSFRKLLVPQGTSLRLSLSTYDGRIGQWAVWGIACAGLAMGLLLGRWLRWGMRQPCLAGLPLWLRWGVLLGAAVGSYFVTVNVAHTPPEVVGGILTGAGLGVLLPARPTKTPQPADAEASA